MGIQWVPTGSHEEKNNVGAFQNMECRCLLGFHILEMPL